VRQARKAGRKPAAASKKKRARKAAPKPKKKQRALSNEQLFKWFTHPYVETVFGGTFHPGGLSLTETLAARTEIRASDRVLDIGCGTGATAVRLAHRVGCRVDGVDKYADLIPVAQARAEREGLTGHVTFAALNAESLPWPDGSLQVVLLEYTYNFLVDTAKVL
jgi:2-polyprenyl-3-methyl-5-hydroxy-6-metoxy-1,4-benzoquinol methylase